MKRKKKTLGEQLIQAMQDLASDKPMKVTSVRRLKCGVVSRVSETRRLSELRDMKKGL